MPRRAIMDQLREGTLPGEAAGHHEPVEGSDRESDKHGELGHTTAELRLLRIEQLQTEALANPDSLRAVFQSSIGAAMRLGVGLEARIEEALKKLSASPDSFNRVSSVI